MDVGPANSCFATTYSPIFGFNVTIPPGQATELLKNPGTAI